MTPRGFVIFARIAFSKITHFFSLLLVKKCGLCNGESAPSPSTDIGGLIALYDGWQEQLKAFELGETCKDVEIFLSKWMDCTSPDRDMVFDNYLTPIAFRCGCGDHSGVS